MSLHKLSAGSGYTYLTRQVAAGDVTARGGGSLGAYYEQRGESPGVWLGAGLASLAGGPRAGDPVSEGQMLALFGRGHHPLASAPTGLAPDEDPAGGPASVRLGAPFVTAGPRVSVAGYDLTFSPVKSISALWALADHNVALRGHGDRATSDRRDRHRPRRGAAEDRESPDRPPASPGRRCAGRAPETARSGAAERPAVRPAGRHRATRPPRPRGLGRGSQESGPARSPPARSPPCRPDAGRPERSDPGRGDAPRRPLLVTRGDDLPARGGAP
jgi:hypothetical protein